MGTGIGIKRATSVYCHSVNQDNTRLSDVDFPWLESRILVIGIGLKADFWPCLGLIP